MQVLILRPYRKDNIYFRTIEEREKNKGSSPLFQVPRNTLKSGQSSNLRRIGPKAMELAAL